MAVESFKPVHWPPLDAFRSTLAGNLLIGRFFSPANMLARATGITALAATDRLWLARNSRGQ
jgi:hypothetical protein